MSRARPRHPAALILLALVAFSLGQVAWFGWIWPLQLGPFAAGPELLANGGFEQSSNGTPAGWLCQNGTLTQAPSPVHGGAVSGALTGSSQGSTWLYQVVAVRGGSHYTLSGFAWKNTSAVAKAYLEVKWYASADGSGPEIAWTTSVGALQTDEATFRFLSTNSSVAPSQARSAAVRAVMVLNAAQPATVFWDDLSFTWDDPPTATAASTSTLAPSPTAPASSTPTGPPPPSATPTLTRTYTPVPGPTATPSATTWVGVTPTATAPPGNPLAFIYINEVLAAPRYMDWASDGVVNSDDEWVELYNAGEEAVDLSGWFLDDALGDGSKRYQIPLGTSLPPKGYLVFFGKVTGLALNNDGDQVNLLWPDGRVADSTSYSKAHYDRSFSRARDGQEPWTEDYPPSPGRPNQPAPTATPTPGSTQRAEFALTSLAQARRLASGTRLAVRGQVTVEAGIFSPGQFYVQDDDAGILVYVRRGEMLALKEGDAVEVRGQIGNYRGEIQVQVESVADIQVLGHLQPWEPRRLATAQVASGNEGLLAVISGQVVELDGEDVYLDDDSGPARVHIHPRSGVRRPALWEGQALTVVGIVSRYSAQASPLGGYRLLPRYQRDFVNTSPWLPNTGQ
ncbi:MAG: lamin tail domain-containing protein [Chloroflexota bacterium]